jgi:hypothetical protein
MLRRAAAFAAVLTLSAPAQAQDPRAASVSAALPAIDGYEKPMDDVVDVSGIPPALTVVRFYSGPAGMVQVQVRLWDAANTESEAALMSDPATIAMGNGETVQIAGHPGAIVNDVLLIYPGRPDSGLTLTVGGTTDRAVLKAIAEKVDFDALLAIN